MAVPIKIITFLCFNLLGFAGISILFHILQLQSTFSLDTDRATVDSFFQNGMLFWAGGTIISIGFFTAKTALKYLFMLTPILTVIFYGLRFLL